MAQLVGHGFGESSNVYIIGNLAVKEYLPFNQKPDPIIRGKNEFDLFTRAQDIPGVAHNVQLFIRGKRIFLTREAGFKPDKWTEKHLLQIQEALFALMNNGICVNDIAQALVRKDGSAFIYDLDFGICNDYIECDHYVTEFRYPIDRVRLWEDVNSSYNRFLREENIEEHDMIEYLKWKIKRIDENSINLDPLLKDKFYSKRLKSLIQQLNKEIQRFFPVLQVS